MSAIDHYAKWRARIVGQAPPMHESEPEAGFWRGRLERGGVFVGIAIWPSEDGALLAMRDHRIVKIENVWPWCGRYPVTEVAYRAWEATGTWPDDHPIPETPQSGSNEPPDEATMLADQIESARAGAADYAEVESDEQAARAQSLRSRLLELSREADKKRETEKRPHFEAGKAVDAKWQPLVKAAKEVADQIARAMGAWETAKAKRAAEAQRKIEEEQRRREAEMRAAEAAGKPIEPPLPMPESVASPPPTAQIRGGYGRAAAVKVVKVVKGISDQDALYRHFHDDPAVVALLTKLAQQAVTLGHSVPGVTVEEERKVA